MKQKSIRSSETKKPSKSETSKSFGYIRVSTSDQNIARQKKEMLDLGIAEKDLYIDYASGKNFDRPQYQALRRTVRRGDTIFFDSLDRLGRTYDDIKKEWLFFEYDVGVDLVCLDIKQMDTREFKKYPDTMRRFMEDLVLNVLSWAASSERNEILRRQRQGIELAKARGAYKGKPEKPYDHALFNDLVAKMDSGEIKAAWAMKQLGMSKSTFFRHLRESRNKGNN